MKAHFVQGALCWLVGEEFRVISPRTCEEMALDDTPGYDPARQRERYEHYVMASIEAYKARVAGRKHTQEELGEMRNAFGPGATVINVLTGEVVKL